ncbi:Thioredoxin-related transmembrane protein 1 [Nymphon striatum]|nr:Thioredoxin-related transmembrane protein 1 [Nymphon striatum]
MIKLYLSLFLGLQLFSGASSKGQLIILTEDTWSDMLKDEWMVEFYAPWCPACRGMQSIWEEFSSWSDTLDIKVAQIDVTTNPGLSGRFMVTALPTFYHVKDGVFRQYKGSRSKDELMSFVEDKKWEEIEPVPSWKAPQSIPFSLHSHFVDNFGIPYWGSYVIFAVGTIFCGTILGLILVCFIDFVYPSKPFELPSEASKDEAKKSEAEGEKMPEKKEDNDFENELRKRKVKSEEASSKPEEDSS